MALYDCRDEDCMPCKTQFRQHAATIAQRDAQVMRRTAAARLEVPDDWTPRYNCTFPAVPLHLPRKTMAEALEAIRFHECTLLRRPEGGWWVAPDTGPDNAFTISNTRFAADLNDAVSAADQIDRRRTGRW